MDRHRDYAQPCQLGVPGIGGVLPGELIVDLFAGGGGASTGIERALGRSPDVAVNHSPDAIACHTANHPSTLHYQCDVYEVDPRTATHGQPVGLLFGSPDCTHHSRSLGSQPRSERVRSLAWVMAQWAADVGPRTIILENVPEFQSWGPLVQRQDPSGRPLLTPHGHPWMVPDPALKGSTFRSFVDRMRQHGYQVDWRTLNAADFGAPTSRERLFLVAARDRAPRWPEPTHGPLRERPYTPVHACLRFDLPAQSILTRRTPLARNTLERIAVTFDRHLLGGCIERTGEPATIIKNYGGVFGHATDRPLGTITCVDHHGLAQPVLVDRPGPAVDRIASLLRDHGASQPPVILTDRGPRYVADITYRMLQVEELARAQGFPTGYRLPAAQTTAQLLIGNSVVPAMAEAVVRANVVPTGPSRTARQAHAADRPATAAR